MKKYPQLFLVMFMPYVILTAMMFVVFSELISGHIIWTAALLMIPISVIAAIATAIYFIAKKKPSEEVLRISKRLKLIHVPSLYFNILVGIFVDFFAIFSTGIIGLSGVILAYKENKLSLKAAVLNAILQFVFFADIFSIVWVYGRVEKAEEKEEAIPQPESIEDLSYKRIK